MSYSTLGMDSPKEGYCYSLLQPACFSPSRRNLYQLPWVVVLVTDIHGFKGSDFSHVIIILLIGVITARSVLIAGSKE